MDSITDQNLNSSLNFSDESCSSRRSSMLWYEQPEDSNEQNTSSSQHPDLSHCSRECEYNDLHDQNRTCHNMAEKRMRAKMMHFQSHRLCRNAKGVDWEDVKRKLALPHSPNFTQQFNILQSEIMNKLKIVSRKSDKYQMSRDESWNRDFDLSSSSLYDNEEICSSSQFSRELERLYERYSPQNNLRKYKMPRIIRHLHQDIGVLEKSANRHKNQNMKSQLPDKIWTEGDYLYSDDLTKKPKYRLLLNPAMRLKLEKEFPMFAHDLELIIKMKFFSLGIPVEVKAYTRLDKHRTSDKTFTVTFQTSTYAKTAMQLIESGSLDFRMNEARPSPSYLVKFIVLYRVSVYEGKCFSRRVRDLQKGDIVTANQERGNKLRIIKHCPRGSKFQHEVKGWVLLQTKEKELLRRIELVDGQIVMKERRFSFIKKPASEHISPKWVPFRALDQVQVYNGNKEPFFTVIDQLDPGAVVYGDKLIGTMLRIIRTDVCGNIQLEHNAQPKPYGWVMLRRKEDGQPQFEFVPRIRKSFQRGTTNHGDYVNHFYQTLVDENQHHRPSYKNAKEHYFFRMIDELSRRNPSLSYSDVMSMVKSGPVSNSVSSMHTIQGASYKGDTNFGSMRSESHSPITTSSNDKNWLAAREQQSNWEDHAFLFESLSATTR